MIRAGVTGAMGRMGQRIIHLMQNEKKIRLAGALEKPGHPGEGKDIGELIGIGRIDVPLVTTPASFFKELDVVIDFTFPEVTLKNASEACKAGTPMVIGTTGFTDAEAEQIRKSSEKVPNLLAPNMSLGINLLLKILPGVANVLGEGYDIEIVEAHHRLKKDAPSGTAVRLAEVLAEALDRKPAESFVYGRQGKTCARRPQEIGIHAVRGGDIVGEHNVSFCGSGERIEIVHKASSRDTFAQGAIRAAQWIVNQKPGLYSMLDMLQL